MNYLQIIYLSINYHLQNKNLLINLPIIKQSFLLKFDYFNIKSIAYEFGFPVQ